MPATSREYVDRQDAHSLFVAVAQMLYKHDELDTDKHSQAVCNCINELRDATAWMLLKFYKQGYIFSECDVLSYCQNMMFYSFEENRVAMSLFGVVNDLDDRFYDLHVGSTPQNYG